MNKETLTIKKGNQNLIEASKNSEFQIISENKKEKTNFIQIKESQINYEGQKKENLKDSKFDASLINSIANNSDNFLTSSNNIPNYIKDNDGNKEENKFIPPKYDEEEDFLENNNKEKKNEELNDISKDNINKKEDKNLLNNDNLIKNKKKEENTINDKKENDNEIKDNNLKKKRR